MCKEIIMNWITDLDNGKLTFLGIAFVLYCVYIILSNYQKTFYLANVTNKVNLANKKFYLDIALMSGYKRIKVSQEVFEYYKIGDKIIW